MRLTPESKSVLDKLLAGDTLRAGRISVGGLDESSRLLLQILIEDYDSLSGKHGADQAETLVGLYLANVKRKREITRRGSETLQEETQGHGESSEERDEGTSSRGVRAIPKFHTPTGWRLHKLKCRSIRGVAPQSEEFEFPFDGKSNLIFGPNGSGKSSLLGAVVWVLTGATLTDAAEPKDIASIHKRSRDLKLGGKICDWPPICTLPDGDDPKTSIPDCMAMMKLRSLDGTSIWFRRTMAKDLEVSFDGQAWIPCPDLSSYGVKPLDLQLSILGLVNK